MKISVLGCGRWGSFHAWYAHRIGHEVMLWGREGSPHLAQLYASRRNEFLTMPEAVRLTDDLAAASICGYSDHLDSCTGAAQLPA